MVSSHPGPGEDTELQDNAGCWNQIELHSACLAVDIECEVGCSNFCIPDNNYGVPAIIVLVLLIISDNKSSRDTFSKAGI